MKSVHWSERAWSDYIFWQQSDPQLVEKINALIIECLRTPFVGIGKPEPLRGELSGYWARRINSEHRFIYQISGKTDHQVLSIVACRFHYQDSGKKKIN
ncbi:MAG: Txe/YoeB family addiction module toxin [Rhizobium sp.]|nr:Txe/YoeB family addiction module toxin [Rhizobium sp.]